MEKRGFKWQIFWGIILLSCVIACLFLPYMRVTGDRYLSVVMEVNRRAEKKDIELARQFGTAEIIDVYERGTSKREEKSIAYQVEIDKALQGRKDSITGVELMAWCFNNDGIIDFRGIETDPTKRIEWAHLEEVFRVMGILLLLPSILALLSITVMLLRRKTQRFLIFLTGIVTIGINIAWLEVIPGMLWERVSEYIVAYDMINAQVLQIGDVGEFSIRMILQQFAAQGYYLNFVTGGILIVTALLYWTAWRPYSKEEIQEEQFIDAVSEVESVEQWEIFGANPLPEKQIQVRQPGEHIQSQPLEEDEAVFPMQMEIKGYLHGVQGQYAGFDFEIEPGEEIVLGRDEEFCDVTFDSQNISRRHCGIRYDELTGCYQVIDYSLTGTALSNGKIVHSGSYVVVHPGTVLYLGSEAEAIRLG
ncbi:MAG: FHA domain-containing protein [Lachnospiraceae bacterium]|nr:FHA domain-containing protein [Lachnospiraceae bacterium]